MQASTLPIQTANILRLETITDVTNGAKVEAFPGPAATQSCANDAAHGKGICYDDWADGLCLACEIEAIERRIVAGDVITVEVRA
jgi:hypothetical protein